MGKKSKNSKRRRAAAGMAEQHSESAKVIKALPYGDTGTTATTYSDSVDMNETQLEQQNKRRRMEHIMICALQLEKLANEPNLYGNSEYKPVRIALHKVLASGVFGNRSLNTNTNNNTSNNTNATVNVNSKPSIYEEISTSLKVKDYEICCDLLKKLRYGDSKPKLGSLQRWVRECDAVFSSDEKKQINAGAIQCLDAILRATHPESIRYISKNLSNDKEVSIIDDLLVEYSPPWDPTTRPQNGEQNSSSSSICDQALEKALTCMNTELLCSIPGLERTPKNEYDLNIYTNKVTESRFISNYIGTPILHRCPFVHDCFLIENLLSPEECNHIITYGEQVGYTPDVPITGEDGMKSVLAHTFVWLIDSISIDTIWSRVKQTDLLKHMPRAIGLNRRLRCYRYEKGAVYRPHIDGAWPPSCLKSEQDQDMSNTRKNSSSQDRGNYIYDGSDGTVLSKFTFLMYLNDDFEGGHTTFYSPSETEGKLERKKIKPSKGSCLIFPHGQTSSALHEGSEVECNKKYVIRTGKS
jgi:hypothetical protein